MHKCTNWCFQSAYTCVTCTSYKIENISITTESFLEYLLNNYLHHFRQPLNTPLIFFFLNRGLVLSLYCNFRLKRWLQLNNEPSVYKLSLSTLFLFMKIVFSVLDCLHFCESFLRKFSGVKFHWFLNVLRIDIFNNIESSNPWL